MDTFLHSIDMIRMRSISIKFIQRKTTKVQINKNKIDNQKKICFHLIIHHLWLIDRTRNEMQ